jgi:hypothetical protein
MCTAGEFKSLLQPVYATDALYLPLPRTAINRR